MKPVDLQASLKDLGRSGKQVAKSLKSLNFKGVRYLPYSCPIAKYLEKIIKEKVTVGTNGAWWQDNPNHWNEISLPNAVQVFIRKFDEGGFPELVE